MFLHNESGQEVKAELGLWESSAHRRYLKPWRWYPIGVRPDSRRKVWSGISSEMCQAFKRSDRARVPNNEPEQARQAAVSVQERKQSYFMIPDHMSLASGCQPQPLLGSKQATSNGEKETH